jgi:hypothetical protein
MINPIVRGGSSAAPLGRSSSTVRRGLRRASDPGHPIWLSQRGAQELIRLDAEAFNALGSTANLLSDTLTDRSGRRGLVGAPAAGHCRARVDTHWALHLGRLGPHVDRVRCQATDASVPAVSPPLQGVAASAARAAQTSLGQGLLGRLGGTDDDHRAIGRT